MPKINFDSSAVENILEIFNKGTDSEGYVVDESGERVITPEGEEIKAKELGGISKGSKVFLKDDFVSILNYSKSKRK